MRLEYTCSKFSPCDSLVIPVSTIGVLLYVLYKYLPKQKIMFIHFTPYAAHIIILAILQFHEVIKTSSSAIVYVHHTISLNIHDNVTISSITVTHTTK